MPRILEASNVARAADQLPETAQNAIRGNVALVQIDWDWNEF
jgi:hypothetical protein